MEVDCREVLSLCFVVSHVVVSPSDEWFPDQSFASACSMCVMALQKQSPAKAAALMQNALNVLGLSRIYTIEVGSKITSSM
jgi:hypothetical protein